MKTVWIKPFLNVLNLNVFLCSLVYHYQRIICILEKFFIDESFTTQPNMARNSAENVSLQYHWHHQIIYKKFYCKVFYRPPLECTAFLFSQRNSAHIKRPVDLFDYESALSDLCVNEQVCF